MIPEQKPLETLFGKLDYCNRRLSPFQVSLHFLCIASHILGIDEDIFVFITITKFSMNIALNIAYFGFT